MLSKNFSNKHTLGTLQIVAHILNSDKKCSIDDEETIIYFLEKNNYVLENKYVIAKDVCFILKFIRAYS